MIGGDHVLRVMAPFSCILSHSNFFNHVYFFFNLIHSDFTCYGCFNNPLMQASMSMLGLGSGFRPQGWVRGRADASNAAQEHREKKERVS